MIKGKSIFLRALEPTDIDLLYEWENNVDVWRISDTLEPFSRFTLEKYIQSHHDIYTHHQLRLVICENETDQPVGFVDLFDFNPVHRRVGCGILIAEEVKRERGFAREAISLVITYCFDILDCHQVYCNILEDNFKSINLFEKVGFERVGLKKEWIKQGEKYLNEYLYQIVKP